MTRWLASLLLLVAPASHAGPIMYVEAAIGGGANPTMVECVYQAGSGTSTTVSTVGLSIGDGDLLVGAYCVGYNHTAATTVLTGTYDPTGGAGGNWDNIQQADSNIDGTPGAALWSRVASGEGTDPTYQVVMNTAGGNALGVCKITGQGATYLDVDAMATGVSDSIDAGGITTVTDSMVVYLGCHDAGGDDFLCPATGGNVDGCDVAASDQGGHLDMGVAWGANSGATGTISFTSAVPASADEWRTISADFQP